MIHSRSVMPPGKTNLAVLEEEIRSLRRQADALNAPSTFAQSAKLSRKARALEKELETKRATQAELSKTINRTVSGFKVSERKLWEEGDGANRQWIRQSLTPPSLPSPPSPVSKWLAVCLAVAATWGTPALVLDSSRVDLWPLSRVLRWPDCQGYDAGGVGSAQAVSTLVLCLALTRAASYVVSAARRRRARKSL